LQSTLTNNEQYNQEPDRSGLHRHNQRLEHPAPYRERGCGSGWGNIVALRIWCLAREFEVNKQPNNQTIKTLIAYSIGSLCIAAASAIIAPERTKAFILMTALVVLWGLTLWMIQDSQN